jgi:protein SCO1/2
VTSSPRSAALALVACLAAAAGALAGEPDDRDLYQLSMALTDQSGSPTTLDVHRGHPAVVTMFYATCPHACPALIADLRRIDGRLTPTARAAARYLLVSLDAAGDSPQVMRELATLHGLDLERWTLARAGSEADVRRLAAALGVKYRRLPDGSFNHTSLVTVLDRGGVVRHQEEGLGVPHDETVAALEAAAPSAGGPAPGD